MEKKLAERNVREAASGVFFHSGVDVFNLGKLLGRSKIVIEIVFIVIGGEGGDASLNAVFGFIED